MDHLTKAEWKAPRHAAMRVAISRFHEGQMVRPSVQARRAGRGKVAVSLSWYDSTDRTYGNADSFTGDVCSAEDWLTSKGVHLDAQGIY